MTPDQRYLFDASGFLHLPGILQGKELQKAQAAVQRYIDCSPDKLPPGFTPNNGAYPHGFAFDKALEALGVDPNSAAANLIVPSMHRRARDDVGCGQQSARNRR